MAIYRTSGLGMLLLVLLMVALAAIFMLTVAGSGVAEVSRVQIASAPSWVLTWQGQAAIRPDLAINGHARKHIGQALDAWKIYDLLLTGRCVASTVYCGPGDAERLYLCVDPASGLVGGLLVSGTEIVTGYGSREAYWRNKTDNGEWGVCR